MAKTKRTEPDLPQNDIHNFQQSSHVTSLEANVLGGIIKEKSALTAVIDILKPDSFQDERHILIYQSILKLFGKSEPIDLLTVTNQLRIYGDLSFAGGTTYLNKIHNESTVSLIERDARLIVQFAIRRQLIQVMSTVYEDSFDDTKEVYQLMDKTEQALRDIQEGHLSKNIPDFSFVVEKTLSEIKQKIDNDGTSMSTPSGFASLDRITGGWHSSELIIIAARPGMGKTAFVVSAIRNAAIDFKMPVAMFSLEMSAQQLMLRLISAEAEIDSNKLRKGDLTKDEWEALHSELNNLVEAPIYIDDTPALSILELRTKARRLKSFHGIKLLVVDYLQLMTAKAGNNGMNREQEIAAISRSLKTLAKELDIPVIALSQLSRSVETRGGDKRPHLSDLRESGSIEQDADVVMFLYRPDYYHLEVELEGQTVTKGYAEVIIAKNRSGSTDTVNLRFIDKYTKFMELDGFYSDKDDYEDIIQNTIKSRANNLE